MKIQNLAVKGFRSLADVHWAPGDLNILIGPNASGKSNLLRVFEMLSASAREELEKYVQREGGMEPLVWDGSEPSIELSVELARRDAPGIVYRLELKRLGKTSSYRIGYEMLKDLGSSGSKWLDRSPLRSVFFDDEGKEYAVPQISEEGAALLSLASGPFSPNKTIPEVQGNLGS